MHPSVYCHFLAPIPTFWAKLPEADQLAAWGFAHSGDDLEHRKTREQFQGRALWVWRTCSSALARTAQRSKLARRFFSRQSPIIPTLPVLGVCTQPPAAERQAIIQSQVIDRIVRAKNVLLRWSFFHRICLP